MTVQFYRTVYSYYTIGSHQTVYFWCLSTIVILTVIVCTDMGPLVNYFDVYFNQDKFFPLIAYIKRLKIGGISTTCKTIKQSGALHYNIYL